MKFSFCKVNFNLPKLYNKIYKSNMISLTPILELKYVLSNLIYYASHGLFKLK
jgi:hypothetical protein